MQIHLDASDIGTLAKVAEEREKRKEALLKSQRRKSTPILLNSHIESLKIEEKFNNTLTTKHQQSETEEEEKKDDEPEKASVSAGNADKQDRKNWDYFEFEIDHPKAISEKKLQQLRAKFSRRRTEGSIGKIFARGQELNRFIFNCCLR